MFRVNPDIHFAGIPEQQRFQAEALKAWLEHVYSRSAFYRRLWGNRVADFQQWNDLQKFPCITKSDIQFHGDEMRACDLSEIADYTTTSGTSGKPITVPLSFSDVERLGVNEAYSYRKIGLTNRDIIQLTTTVDRSFMAGLAYLEGARKMRIPIVRTGSGMPEMQWERIFSLGTTVLIAVPSFIIKMLDYAHETGIGPQRSSVKKILCIGEPIHTEDLQPNEIAERIRRQWNVQLFSTYASTEMQTAFTECEAGKGMHANPDLIICEFLDEELNPVPEGTPGELVITHLGVTALPLVRFRTGDICTWHSGTCSCGRNSMRIGPILGRKQQMIKYKGTSLYPASLQNVADSFAEVQDYLIYLSSNEIGTDEVELILESTDRSEEFVKRIKDSFRARIRVTPVISMEGTEKIHYLRGQHPSRKILKIIDARKS